MTPRERFLAALRGEPVDRTPTAYVSALTNVEMQERTGCRMPAVHFDPARLATLCYANHEVLGFDGVTFLINYFNEPAALGVEMDWGSERALPMYLSHPWKVPGDAVAVPDILDRPPVSTGLEALRIAKKRYGDRVAVLGKIMGPFSMTQVMHGVDQTMMDAIMAPDTVRRFVDTCVEMLIRCANAQFEAGADAVAIGEGGAGANMMSPRMYEDLLLEPHQRLIGGIRGPTILHICGDVTSRLDAIGRTGVACFNFDWEIDPVQMKRAAAGRFAIMGNVNTTDLLLGSPGTIAAQVKRCQDAGVDIISPGCAVSPESPTANLRAISDAARAG